MKIIMILLILTLTSCKSGNPATTSVEKKITVLEYSKSPCLGRCPVYTLIVFSDGIVLYESRDVELKKVSVICQLSREQMEQLTSLLANSLEEPILFQRIRDRPVTVLKYDDNRYEYHASKIDGLLKQVNTRIEHLVAQVNDE